MNFTKFFAAAAVSVFCANVANAETVSQEFKYDFTTKELGFKINSYWGGLQDHMQVVANPFGEEGNLMYIDGMTEPQPEDAQWVVWSTYPRIEGLTLPAGFNFSHIQMIEVTYRPTQNADVPFGIKIRQQTNDLYASDPAVAGEWNTAVFFPDEFTKEGSEDQFTSTASSFDFCLGQNGSSLYYLKDIVFYLEKDVTQRELDEDNLDKSTAACVEVNFDNWETSYDADGNFVSSTHVGSNGFGTNRTDMIIDKGPEGYNNNCVHIIYQGWTQIFLADAIQIPEGYTFDDLRLIEYDIYETTEAGVDMNNPASPNSNRNGAPILKLKNYYNWGAFDSNGNGSACGNSQLPSVNEWHHVEFRPSAYEWGARDFKQDVLDEDGNVKKDDEGNNIQEDVHWDGAKTCEEFGKLTSFNMSVGFFPCNCQAYVDNVKCWFQKSGAQTGLANVVAAPAAEDWNVYNLQGIRVMKAACEADIYTLPAGLYIANGKKYLVK